MALQKIELCRVCPSYVAIPSETRENPTVIGQPSSARGAANHRSMLGRFASKELQPFTDVDLPKKKNGMKGGRQPFKPGDLIKLRLATVKEDPELADLIMLAMYTGCRIEELASLKVKDVYSDASIPYIAIKDAKTAAACEKSRSIQISRRTRPEW